jgi:hypothetical protein
VAKEAAMSATPHEQSYREAGAAQTLVSTLVRWRVVIIAFAVGFPIVFYLGLLATLIVQYGHLPNYAMPYDWIANVLRIIHHTRSVSDMVPIILNEWLIEIGYIDYSYGHGVADWSLAIIPHKLAIMSLAGALIGLNIVLLIERQPTQTLPQQCVAACRSGLLTSMGAFCSGLPSMTVFSVACCAAPSWAGSLTILGFDTAFAFAIEPFGPIASLLGLAALVVSALCIARGEGLMQPARPMDLARGHA